MSHFDEIERRKFLKYCIHIKCHGLGDYKAFYDDLVRLKIKFKYRLYKIILLNYFCIDITEVIISYL